MWVGMASEKSDEKFEPGAAQFGNFINYYEFNPPSNRLALFQGEFVDYFKSNYPENEPLVCLDVGCNSGELTRGLAKLLSAGRKGPVHMLGVDLDPQLVQRATEMNKEEEDDTTLEFRTLNAVTDAGERDNLFKDFLNRKGSSQMERFHIAFCFSTTMWVHLNHGDDGLEAFLTSLCSWADHVILEPQPWKCYRSAARRLRRAGRPPFPHFETLLHRSNVLEHIDIRLLRQNFGMQLHAHLGQSEWNRPVSWYKH